METNTPMSEREALRLLVERGGADAPRVERIELEDQVYWVKRVERLSLRMRLQKGSPRRAFEAERCGLHDLAALDAPVSPIVCEARDWFVVADCGPTVSHVLHTDPDPAVRARAMALAGAALGRLHRLGVSHGRPSPKDICLREGQVTFIDLERYRRSLNRPSGQARDLVIFVFNTLVNALDDAPELAGALEAYRREAPPEIWPLAQDWCRRWRWANWVTKPIQARREGRGREFKAIPRVLEVFLPAG